MLTVLGGVDLSIEPGEFVAILGPSGSGKSTLLGLAAGLDRPTSGEVWLDGEPVHSLSEDALALLRRRKVGFVFQSFQLLSNLTALENVMFPLELLGRERPEKRAMELLVEVGLGDRTHHYPVQLSGGEQQRVAIAAAAARQAPLVLADEPTGELDQANEALVLGALHALRDAGSTVVVVTHSERVAESVDRVIEVRDGRVVG